MSKIAMVTGASSGIGKACALALLREGWHVALVGRRAEALQAVASESGSPRALVVTADVSKEDDVQHLFATVAEKFGRLDLLFNNAGVSAPGVLLEDLSLAQ